MLLYIIIYHYISLYIIIYHYISLYIIIYHYISLNIIIYNYISLYIIIYHYISLYIIKYHYISLYISIYQYIYILFDIFTWIYIHVFNVLHTYSGQASRYLAGMWCSLLGPNFWTWTSQTQSVDPKCYISVLGGMWWFTVKVWYPLVN